VPLQLAGACCNAPGRHVGTSVLKFPGRALARNGFPCGGRLCASASPRLRAKLAAAARRGRRVSPAECARAAWGRCVGPFAVLACGRTFRGRGRAAREFEDRFSALPVRSVVSEHSYRYHIAFCASLRGSAREIAADSPRGLLRSGRQRQRVPIILAIASRRCRASCGRCRRRRCARCARRGALLGRVAVPSLPSALGNSGPAASCSSGRRSRPRAPRRREAPPLWQAARRASRLRAGLPSL
jgi:hypothetical protein